MKKLIDFNFQLTEEEATALFHVLNSTIKHHSFDIHLTSEIKSTKDRQWHIEHSQCLEQIKHKIKTNHKYELTIPHYTAKRND